MNSRCPMCGRKFERAPGYLLGSIYFNYGVTAIVAIAMCLAMCIYRGQLVTDRTFQWSLAAFAALFAVWFFRYARSLWIAFDERWDPWPNEQEAREEANLK